MAMKLPALIDTNAILALLNASDPNHLAARSVLPIGFLLPSLVLPEVDYLATTRLGANVARAFQKAVIRGDFEIVHNTNADFARALEIQEQYSDLELGLVDSSIMAIAERLVVQRIFTFDRRHFLAVKPKGLGYFEILP
jgi:uncharacterized protein